MSVREVNARLVLDIKDAKARLNELERQIKAIEKAKIQFAANTAELDRLENRLKEIIDLGNLANLRNRLADIKDDISNLKKELYSLNNKKLAIDIELKQNANDIQDVLNDKTLSEGKRDDLLKGLYNMRQQLKYELNEVGIEMDKIQQKINNFNKEKIKVEADISSLKDAEKLANEFDNTIADLDKEEIDINTKTDKLENANKQLGDMISKEGEVNNTAADVKSQIIGFEDSMNKLNRLQQAAKALKTASKITFDVGNKMSNLGSGMLNIAKNFQNNPIGDIGRFLVQGVGYSGLYRLVSGAQNAIGNAVSEGVSRYDTINVAKRTLATVTSDVEDNTTKIQKMIDNLDKSIEGLPTTLNDALSHVTRFTSINHDLDRSQKLFSAINDAIISFGGSSENVNNAVTQYSQIMGSKMDARTLRSLEEAKMMPALTAIAKKFNMTFPEFREAFTGSNPTISLQQFEDALIELDEKGGGGLSSLAQMVKTSASTITNAMELISTRSSKAFANVLGALDEVVTNVTGDSIYGHVYDLTEKILNLGDRGAEFVRGHQKEIGEGIDFIKTKFSELWGVLKTFSFKDFIGGFRQGLDDFKGAIDFFKPLVGGLYDFAKDKITEMGDGSFSKGLGRFVSDYIKIGIGLKLAGRLMKLGSGGIGLLGDLLNIASKFKGKNFNIPFLGKLGSKFSSIKDVFKSSDEITAATSTPKTFDVEGFKNKLSSLAIIAGGAGTIILYCKAIKEIEKNVPDDITTLPMRLTNLFSIMGLMMGANTLNAAVSKALEMNNALTGLAMMIGQGGALWLFAKAMQELDKTMPDGFDTFNDKLLGLFECIGSMTLITGIQGGAGVLTGGITTLAQVLGMITTTGIAGTLIACAKAMQEVDKNVPSKTKGLKKKIQGIMDVIDMFEGGGTYSSWWSQVIKSSESLWKNMETWNITSILKKLVTIGESISKVQGMNIDSSSFNDQYKDIQDVIKNINDFEFPTVSASSATNIAYANSIVTNCTTMASSLSEMSNVNGSSINVENCTSILKNVASVVSEMKKIVFPDVTKSIKSNLNSTNAQELLDTLKILEQIVPEFGNLQAVMTSNPLPKAEDIKKTIESISQAIGYISVAGAGTGKDENMLSYNLRQIPDAELFTNALDAITTLGDMILEFGTLNVYSYGFDFESLRANIKEIGDVINDLATNKGLTKNTENIGSVDATVTKLKTICDNLNSIVGLNLDFVKVGKVTKGIQTFLNNVKGLKVGEATTDVVTEVNSIVTSFHNMATTLSNMKSEFNTSGTDMANGIIEGFKSVDIEGSFGTKIDNAKTSMKKKSFKSVGKKFGKDVVSGFSEGISNMSSSISNQITMMYGYSTRFSDLGQYLGSTFKNAFNTQSGSINTGGTTTPTVNRGNESKGNNMKFAKGGPVYLKRGGQPIVMKPSGTDTVPAMLTPGEYVMKRSAVKNAGQSFMDKVNNMDLKGAFKELSTRYGSQVGSVVNKNVTINNNDNRVTNNSIAFNEGNERRQAIKVGRCLRGLA